MKTALGGWPVREAQYSRESRVVPGDGDSARHSTPVMVQPSTKNWNLIHKLVDTSIGLEVPVLLKYVD